MKKKPPATVPGAAKEDEEAAQTFASGGAAGSRPPKRARDDSGDVDFISNLPDEILGTIVSLLPTKDGGRTQALARRWRPLWRSAPLNIDAHNLASRYPPRREGPRPPWRPIVSGILSDHPGPVRRLDFRRDSTRSTKRRYDEDVAYLESWLNSGKLRNLQELHILFPFLFLPSDNDRKLYWMPSSVLRFASTVIAATIGLCDFPNKIAPSLKFPLLKHLSLERVSISEDVFHRVLSACHVLETLFLELEKNDSMTSLHISSATLRSIAFSDLHMGALEFIVQDTPHLERLLCTNLDFETNIRVNKAPKLEMLGPLSPYNFNIQIGKLVFQGLVPTSLNHLICTVKVLALQCSFTKLDAVLDILRVFPCLEKLYIMGNEFFAAQMNNVRQYDPLHPIKCLQTHLKKLVLKNYKGGEQDVSFAKFFVLNAKVLNEIKFGVEKKIDKKWVADQHRLLGVENKASPDAQFEFILVSSYVSFKWDTHADPFTSLLADGVNALSEEAGSCD